MISVKNLNRILWAVEYSFQASKYQIWLTNAKLFFSESETNLKTLQKLSPCIWISYNFVLKSVKNLNGIFWANEFWFKALKYQIWLGNKKPFFWESEASFETLQDFSAYISVSYKFVLKSLKNLNRILWVTEYWFKALKCQYWLRNTKPFFLKNERNVETLQNFSHHIWVCHKFILRSAERMNRIFWVKEFRFKASKCQIWLAIKKPYFWESERNFEPFQKLPKNEVS